MRSLPPPPSASSLAAACLSRYTQAGHPPHLSDCFLFFVHLSLLSKNHTDYGPMTSSHNHLIAIHDAIVPNVQMRTQGLTRDDHDHTRDR